MICYKSACSLLLQLSLYVVASKIGVLVLYDSISDLIPAMTRNASS